MKIGTVIVDGARHAGILLGDTVGITDFGDALEAIRFAGPTPADLLAAVTRTCALSAVRIRAPIPRPGKIFGSGINYRSHQIENPAAELPTEPGFFSKFPSSVIGQRDPIRLPTAGSQVDYEVELAVVIGTAGRDIGPEDAFGHVFGYTVINDVSGRDVQFRANQMDLGKGFDTFCPMGPWIVTADEVARVDRVAVRSWVNGQLRQDATTADWLFSVPELLEHASRHLTLEPGDLVTTGTPAGCGTFRTPPLWLQPGDEVIVEADVVGRLSNPVVAGW